MSPTNTRPSRIVQCAVVAAILGAAIAGAQDLAWKAGATLSPAATEGAAALTLVAGEAPGAYVLPSVNATLKLTLTPATAEAAVPLRLSAEDAGTQTFTAPRIRDVSITTRFLDAETFVAEVKAAGRDGALFSAEVSQLDGQTSAPVTSVSSRPEIIIEGRRDAKVLQVFSHNAFRMRNGQATVIVAPIEPNESLFISLGTKERTWKEITGREEPERAKSPFKALPGRGG